MIAIIYYFEYNTNIKNEIYSIKRRLTHTLLELGADMFGYTFFMIDRTGKERGNKVFTSLDNAIADPRFARYIWIYFDINSPDFYEDLIHPSNDVVYVIGSDIVNYDGKSIEDRNGKSYRLRVKNIEQRHYASAVVSYVMASRWTK